MTAHPPPATLETARLLLRPFTLEDIEPFYVLGTDPEILRYIGGGFASKEAALECLRTRPLRDYEVHGYGRLAVVEKSSGRLIGFSGLKFLDGLGAADIGYRFVPDAWGKGYATESALTVMKHGREVLRLTGIVGLVMRENARSARVLEKLGLRYTKQISLKDLGDGLWDLYE